MYNTVKSNWTGTVQYLKVLYNTVWRRLACLNLKVQIDQGGWFISSKSRNKKIKSKNGNGTEKVKTLKVVNWNLGPRLWVNKVDDLNHMIQDYKPDIAIISEANIHSTDDCHRVNINNYDLVNTIDFSEHGFGRLVVLTKTGLRYQVLENKMEKDISTIWLKICRHGKKPLYIVAVYREHRLLHRQGPNLSADFQEHRWMKILQQWISTNGTEEMIIAGDLNLDYLRWNSPEQRQKWMIEKTKENVETLGFVQMVQGPTRFWNDTAPSLLDQVWANKPNRIHQCRNITRAVADHNLIETIVNMKTDPRQNIEIRKRKWNQLDNVEFQRRIANENWEDIYSINDVNMAYNFLEERIKKHLNDLIPIMKLQPRGRNSNWISVETRELMIQRDNQREIASRTNSELDWREYRRTRNMVTSKVKTDRKKFLDDLYSKADKDTKELYRITTEQLGWKVSGPQLVAPSNW